MKGRRLAILGAGPEQIVAVNTAKGLGYETVAVDDNPNAPAKEHADIFVCTRIKDTAGLVEALRPYNISGVMTHAAELAVETALVAAAFALPGLSVESAMLGTLKHLRIKRLKQCGLNVAKYEVLDKDAALERWLAGATSLGYPLVAKPTDGKGASGVLLIDNATDMEAYYKNIRLKTASDFYILEQYLRGLQLSTETIISKGIALRHNIAYRHYGAMERYHPYLIEDGHSMPVDLDKALLDSIEGAIDLCARAMGVTNGVIKGDILIDKEKRIYIIEMAVRSSGGRFADFVSVEQCGVNIVKAMVQIAMGDAVDRSNLDERFSKGVSQRFIFLEVGKKIRKMPDLDDIRETKGLLEMVFSPTFLKDLTQRAVTSHGDRIGYVICRAKTRVAADKLARSVCAQIKNRMEAL